MKLLSIITPTLSRTKYLKKNLKEIDQLYKDFKNFEWVVVIEKKDKITQKFFKHNNRKFVKKVIGGVGDAIRGIPSVGRLDDLKGFGNRSFGKSTKTFKFPLDVDTSPGLGNQGHYIMFYINEQQNAQLTFGTATGKNGTTSVLSEQNTRGISNVAKKIITRTGGKDIEYVRDIDFENKQKYFSFHF